MFKEPNEYGTDLILNGIKYSEPTFSSKCSNISIIYGGIGGSSVLLKVIIKPNVFLRATFTFYYDYSYNNYSNTYDPLVLDNYFESNIVLIDTDIN